MIREKTSNDHSGDFPGKAMENIMPSLSAKTHAVWVAQATGSLWKSARSP